MMRFLYTLAIYVYATLIKLASPFSSKANLFYSGRRSIFKRLASAFENNSSKVIWFHCASLGEFEQGRPLIERMRETNPDKKILLTFFSPSGYEIRKNYSKADWVFYLPIDSPSNAKRLLDIVKPEKAIFVKYEFWFNYLDLLFRRRIPCYFISVNLRKDQYFFKWYGAWALTQLKKISHFFVQNKTTHQLLIDSGINQSTIAGDTRFDRVFAISNLTESFPLLERFIQQSPCIVAGSTWAEDERLLASLGSNIELEHLNLKLILAPHEIKETNLKAIEAIFSHQGIIRYSQLTTSEFKACNVLIIDNIGMLSSLYRYASICYVGGGFGKGIHNILEAAVFGKPILFGPNFTKFEEAKSLVRLGGAIVISHENELQEAIKSLLLDEKKYREKCEISQAFVHDNLGAVTKISSKIESLLS